MAGNLAEEIIDNQQHRLADRVRDLLAEGATEAYFAVGYLFLDGLVPLRAQLERVGVVKLLIGNVVSRVSDEQVREETGARQRGGESWVRDQEDVASTLRGAHDRAAAETALNLRRTLADLPRTEETRALLLALARRVADGGLQVRLYTEGRIHAKLALLSFPAGHPRFPGVAITGSSNMTLGSEAAPTELNVLVRDPDVVAGLVGWYQNLWDMSQDFRRELFDELGQCWALHDPTA